MQTQHTKEYTIQNVQTDFFSMVENLGGFVIPTHLNFKEIWAGLRFTKFVITH